MKTMCGGVINNFNTIPIFSNSRMKIDRHLNTERLSNTNNNPKSNEQNDSIEIMLNDFSFPCSYH